MWNLSARTGPGKEPYTFLLVVAPRRESGGKDNVSFGPQPLYDMMHMISLFCFLGDMGLFVRVLVATDGSCVKLQDFDKLSNQ